MDNAGQVLLLPYPSQGHLNPMLQFGKRLAAHGLLVTLAATRFILGSSRPEPGPVRFAAISDGFDATGFAGAGSAQAYLGRFELVGSETLESLLRSEAAAGRPVRLLVFDAFLPWAGDVGRRLGAATAAFFTQSSAVDALYYHVWERRLCPPVQAEVELPGLPRLTPRDLPLYLVELVTAYPAYMDMVMNQFKCLEKADEILINSFYELEPEVPSHMFFFTSTTLRTETAACGAKTVGPTVPSKYLDDRLPFDSHYGLNLFTPAAAPCMRWLDSKPPASVVYVSFGSMAVLGPEQTAELAFGISDSGKDFLWVVRSSETGKLPRGFAEGFAERGLVVSWSPQTEVLAHPAVGCFLTHCGWNSTAEGLSLGVPMVAMPQWTDQLTNAKYVEDVWGVGVRVREDEKGLVRREEVERCVREVLEGGRREEMRRNAAKWRERAKAAVGKDGSSDKNVVELIAKYCTNT
ncbi:unnamed protein product [Musa textilis]